MEGSSSDTKKRRVSHAKSRTGCTACKIRRVKCDEEKPECYKCQEYGSICEYEAPQPRAGPSNTPPQDRSQLVPIQPRPQQPLSGPSNSFEIDEVEGRYYRLFHEKLAFDLSGYFDSPFWTRLIPQESHHEPGVKYAILALSALYKSAISSKTNTVTPNDEHVKFALVKHSQAISSLRKTLSRGGPQLRLALITSLLFSCFESFHGDWSTATQQVYSGLNILKRLKEDQQQGGVDAAADISFDVGVTFRRLELQILSFLSMTPTLENPFNDMTPEDIEFEVPDPLTTLNEAFVAATNLAVSILRHSRAAARCGDDPTARSIVTQRQAKLQGSMSQWNKAYSPLFLSACQKPANREYLGILQLRICMWKCEIVLATSLSSSEVIYDDFTAEFRRITHFARVLLQKDQEVRQAIGPKLQYGMGLIMALFFTATRCRDRNVRREAVTILREWPCTNGIWHSLQAAKVAEWIVSLEEESSGGAEVLPVDCRVQLQSLKVTWQKGEIAVECLQYSGGVLQPRIANLEWN